LWEEREKKKKKKPWMTNHPTIDNTRRTR